jgi:hypothetical protein
MPDGELYSNSFASYTAKKSPKTTRTETKIIFIRREIEVEKRKSADLVFQNFLTLFVVFLICGDCIKSSHPPKKVQIHVACVRNYISTTGNITNYIHDLINAESKGFWSSTSRITGFVDFVHHP